MTEIEIEDKLDSVDLVEELPHYTAVNFDAVDLTPLELEVLKRMRAVVEAKGYDYVYPHASSGNCQYFETEEVVVDKNHVAVDRINYQAPSCLVGHVFAEMGLSQRIDIFCNESGIDTIVENVFCDYPASEQTHALRQALMAAQRFQDAASTWGQALRVFEETLHDFAKTRQDRRAASA